MHFTFHTMFLNVFEHMFDGYSIDNNNTAPVANKNLSSSYKGNLRSRLLLYTITWTLEDGSVCALRLTKTCHAEACSSHQCPDAMPEESQELCEIAQS